MLWFKGQIKTGKKYIKKREVVFFILVVSLVEALRSLKAVGFSIFMLVKKFTLTNSDFFLLLYLCRKTKKRKNSA